MKREAHGLFVSGVAREDKTGNSFYGAEQWRSHSSCRHHIWWNLCSVSLMTLRPSRPVNRTGKLSEQWRKSWSLPALTWYRNFDAL